MLTLLGQHPEFECVFACSSSQAGDLVQQHVPAAPNGLVFENLTPDEAAARKVDAGVVLPDGHAATWCPAFEGTDTVILDEQRPPLHRRLDLRPHRTFSRGHHAQHTHQQPGCYATAGNWPASGGRRLGRSPHGFGVSGYSGAGRTPSP